MNVYLDLVIWGIIWICAIIGFSREFFEYHDDERRHTKLYRRLFPFIVMMLMVSSVKFLSLIGMCKMSI